MARVPRIAPSGFVFHVLNRASEGRLLFDTGADYAAFEALLAQARERFPVQLLAWCLMPNHWHLVLRPDACKGLSAFMHFLTLTHAHRWRAYRNSTGKGHLYQGPFKSFLVQEDEHFIVLCRYVESNALRARLANRAEEWRWSSLWHWHRGAGAPPAADPWPLPRPSDWIEQANEIPSSNEMEALRACTVRGTPFGEATWKRQLAERHGVQTAVRPRGRPPKRET